MYPPSSPAKRVYVSMYAARPGRFRASFSTIELIDVEAADLVGVARDRAARSRRRSAPARLTVSMIPPTRRRYSLVHDRPAEAVDRHALRARPVMYALSSFAAEREHDRLRPELLALRRIVRRTS